MHKYHGQLIHKVTDELGDIEIVDDPVYRSLHFGSEPRQSSMLLRDPLYLALAYTRAMACALLFQDKPQKALLIGLGGGSLAKFLLHYFPQCDIEAIETREAVRDVARSHFLLPDDPRLTLHFTDGGNFVRNKSLDSEGEYDLIFVDAFVDNGIARSVCGISFFEACRSLLGEQGILSMNLWNGDFITARDMLEDIRDSFDGNVLHLPVEGKDNTIALAGNGTRMKKQLKRLKQQAETLGTLTGIEYNAYVKQLKKHNSWLGL